MSEASVPGFVPSVHGFHFANRWPPGPTIRIGPLDPRWVGIGDARDGLCGGMCYTVADLFTAGIAVPPDREPPVNGSPRFRHVVRRQIESLDWLRVPARYWLRAALGDRFGRNLLADSVETEWPRIKAEIDNGRLAVVGVIRHRGLNPMQLVRDHQVIAHGYAEDGRGVTLRLYDPNWPDHDDVTLHAELDPAFRPVRLTQSTGEPLFGWFLLPYSPRNPTAWR